MMTQHEITNTTALLNARGEIMEPGFARHLNYVYEPNKIRAFSFPKEWDFYQISDSEKVLQLTIGHTTYALSVSANLFFLNTGRKLSCGITKLFSSIPMEQNGEAPHTLEYAAKGFDMKFETSELYRKLTLHAQDKINGAVDISITLGNCSADKEKMVIATPFNKRGHFYLNYKENCFTAEGEARFGGESFIFGDNAFALLDWGRGVWPYSHEWYWGNGSCRAYGKLFGFNIGWGFGNTSAASENMFFYDNKAYKLGRISQKTIGKLPTLRYHDEDGRFDFTAVPIYDNFTTTKLLFVNNSCHQVFSHWSGSVKLDSGETLNIDNFVAFLEHSVNHW